MSERTGLWPLRLLAFGLALVVWYFASVEKREQLGERLLDVSVTYNAPRGLIILDPVQAVRVRLRGSDRRMRSLSPSAVDVVVEPLAREPGAVEVHLGAENVVRPDDLEVVSIEPNSLRLQLDREGTRLVPVRPRLVGEPAAGALPQNPTATPDAVVVSGPESRLRDLAFVPTGPIALDGHALDFEETVIVLSPDPLLRIVEPSMVTVRVPMAPPELDSSAPRRRRG